MGDTTFEVRPYAGESDIEPIAAVVRAAALGDGLPFVNTSEDFRTDVLEFAGVDPARDIVVVEADGRVVAAGWLRNALRDGEWRVDQEAFVDPAYRRRGIGQALFAALAGRGEEILGRHRDGRERRSTTMVDDRDVGARTIVESAGYTPFRWFAIMGRDLATPGPGIRSVEGIELRPIQEGDRRAVFAALAEAFEDHPGHRVWTDEDFHRMFGSPGTDLSLWRVAWDGDEVAGVSMNAFSEEEAEALGCRQGWLHTIGVRRPWRGRGIAKLVVASSLAGFRARGYERAVLAVDMNNPTGALGLYEGLGFVPLSRATSWARAFGPAR